ncbi:MAG TPA: mechanosensitive ion channel domain-containing protein, partial [Alphaproteobacteria bacterium]|nr:mechanosensitive ion channel domain-containing protein [Alphaproteobacteria bacterium]
RATVITVLVLVGFHFVLRGIDELMAKGFALPGELRRQFPHLEERTNSYLPILQRVLKIAVWIAGILVLLGAWGVDTVDWLTQPPGKKVFAAIIAIAITLFLTVLAWELVDSMIERYLRGDERSGRRIERSARMRTLLPLLRYTLQILLVVVAGVIILDHVGVNTTPLLAGAGIIGLAIGFGSQALVKDVITGLFILLEDTMSVGDIVKIGDHAGLVEAITIRTVRLRDANGYVHTVPFGELTSIINMTKHYAHVVLEVPVTFDTDWRKVMQIMKSITEEMRKDERFESAIFEPMEMQGVNSYEDGRAIILARIKTQPLQQWNVKREYLLRLKERLDKEGISLPYPVSMNFPLSMLSAKGGTPQTPWEAETPETPAIPQTPPTPDVPETPPTKTPALQTKDEKKVEQLSKEAKPPPSP